MKIKRIFLSFILMMSLLCAVACKDKKKEPEPETPAPSKAESVVHASTLSTNYLVGTKLADIELLLAMGDTNGTIVWDDEHYEIVLGENECDWTFTPADTDAFKTKTGSLTLNGFNLDVPEVADVELVAGQTVYIEQKYAGISLQGTATFGGQTVEGTFGWKEPTKTFVEGENVCTWVFRPTDTTKYAEVEGTITVSATVVQEPMSLSATTSKTDYVAFDTIDLSTVTLRLIYTGGKTEVLTFGADDVTITYDNDDCLRRGDRKATITHDTLELSAEIALDEVDYRIVQVPEFTETIVYNGDPRVLTLASNADSDKYTFEPLTRTNADDYDLVVTLENPNDDKWSNGDIETTTVVCTILKAELDAEETNCSEEYDGEAHSVSVSSPDASRIFYSETLLDESNYADASTDEISKTDAGTYTIYYFLEGDSNHNSKAGSLTISISRQTPTMSLEYCYTLETGNVVNYPSSYVTITDKQGNSVSLGELTFTYYNEYTDDGNDENDTLTSTEDGASLAGKAPKNDKVTEYYVVVGYAGNKNYNAVESHTVLFIDGADLALYAKGGEDAFAFKYDENGYYGESFEKINSPMVSASNSECNAYLEFKANELDETTGLKTIEFISKFGEGANFKKSGRLVFVGVSYLLLTEDGASYSYTYNGTSDEISVKLSEQSSPIVLKKWTLPKYLNTYTAKTLSDEVYNAEGYDKTKNTSQNTEIEFYNDYGTIRFVARINVAYSGGVVANGGYVEWKGVAEFGFPDCADRKTRQALGCYITDSDSGYNKNENKFFRVVWDLEKVGEFSYNIVEEPTEFTIDLFAPVSQLAAPYNTMQYLDPANEETIVKYTKVQD